MDGFTPRAPPRFRDVSRRASFADAELMPLSLFPYYLAIFEFAQGSSPRTAYEHGGDFTATEKDSFRFSVVNTPTTFLSDWDSPPIIVRSQWGAVHYVACFIQIPDVQARGFSRAIVLVVANRLSAVIDYVAFHDRRSLESVVSRLQAPPRSTFPRELCAFSWSLRSLIDRSDADTRLLLTPKYDELQALIRRHNLRLPAVDPASCKSLTVEAFTIIRDELRSVEELIGLRSAEPALRKFVEGLPADALSGRYLMAAWGGGTAASGVSLETLRLFTSVPDHRTYTLLPHIGTRALQNCLFSLFSGRTVALTCRDRRSGMAFAERLAVMSPVGDAFAIGKHPASNFEYQRFPIVVGRRIVSEFVSVFNLDEGTFEGSVCPADSIIMREFFRTDVVSDAAIAIGGSQDAKRIFGRFTAKVAELTSRSIHTRARLCNSLAREGFALSDEPIIRCWIFLLADAKWPHRRLFLGDVGPPPLDHG
jgi:hypothetical protein